MKRTLVAAAALPLLLLLAGCGSGASLAEADEFCEGTQGWLANVEGSTLTVEPVGMEDAADVEALVKCIVAELGAPASLMPKIEMAGVDDPPGSDEWDGHAITWSQGRSGPTVVITKE